MDNFDDIRPYYDHEINDAMCRIAAHPLFKGVADFLFEGKDIADVQNMFRQIQNINEFQAQVMHHSINLIIKKTMAGYSYNGMNLLDKSKTYLFVSNHRDILLDSAIFQVALYDNGFKSTEITFGSNLMQPDFVVDIGKSNKMFKVERGGSPRDFYHHSNRLSQYIRYTLLNKKESIWIAQRNGRTKDGNDTTDQGILKMFSMSGQKNDILQNIGELNIVPLSISYQWEPCDIMKVKELYVSKTGTYVKAPGEDLNSILTGITQYKGGVHIEVTPPITPEELSQFNGLEKNDLYASIAKLMDTRVRKNYKLWDTNFIAFDILNKTSTYQNKYTNESREGFIQKMKQKLSALEGDRDMLETIYLGIYATPVKNVFE